MQPFLIVKTNEPNDLTCLVQVEKLVHVADGLFDDVMTVRRAIGFLCVHCPAE